MVTLKLIVASCHIMGLENLMDSAMLRRAPLHVRESPAPRPDENAGYAEISYRRALTLPRYLTVEFVAPAELILRPQGMLFTFLDEYSPMSMARLGYEQECVTISSAQALHLDKLDQCFTDDAHRQFWAVVHDADNQSGEITLLGGGKVVLTRQEGALWTAAWHAQCRYGDLRNLQGTPKALLGAWGANIKTNAASEAAVA